MAMVYAIVALGCLLLAFLFFVTRLFSNGRIASPRHIPPPEVPGLPLIGNLLQFQEKPPHETFTKWADVYGPIYSIRTGASRLVVLNSTDVAKEAMVARYSSISTRKLSSALKIITNHKSMVASSDYDEFYKMVKRNIVISLLGANAQKRFRCHRDTLIENVLNCLLAHVENNPDQAVNFRNIFRDELFGLALKEALGNDMDSSIYVEDLGTRLSREEIYQVLAIDPLMGATEVDWRDLFPYLRWIPNKSLEMKIKRMDAQKEAVMKALTEEPKKRIAMGQKMNCYLDYLLSEAKTLTEKQLLMLLWEVIVESSDTILVTTEWCMYELAKDAFHQDRLYQEIQKICGSDKISEEHLSQLPYLNAVFRETLRKYSPAPVLLPRYVHEDTELGGYHIPAGTQIVINIYGCNMNKKQWDEPEKWKPERFLDSKYDSTDLYKTMAFGGGKRVCAGALQAMLIACTAIGRSVQEFEWRLKEGEEGDINTVRLTTCKLNPLQVMIKRRER